MTDNFIMDAIEKAFILHGKKSQIIISDYCYYEHIIEQLLEINISWITNFKELIDLIEEYKLPYSYMYERDNECIYRTSEFLHIPDSAL